MGLVLAGLLTAGCSSSDDDAPDEKPSPQPADPAAALGPTSPKANVQFKGSVRMGMELARILDLHSTQTCTELGLYDCFAVHNVVLGGTDPFGVALYEPMEQTSATTPLAVERVVLSACLTRSKRDFDAPDLASIYIGIPTDEAGAIVNLEDSNVQAAMSAAVNRLVQRALQRSAKPSEIDHHKALYLDVLQSGESERPARDWATMSCFVTLTSLEWLFY